MTERTRHPSCTEAIQQRNENHRVKRFAFDSGRAALELRGRFNRNLVAFARRRGENWLLAVVPRLCSQLTPVDAPPLGSAVWGETVLPLPPGAPQVWENIFTRASVRVAPGKASPALPLAEIFRSLPVALLSGTTSDPNAKS